MVCIISNGKLLVISKFDNISKGLALLIPYVTECVVDSSSSSRCCILYNYKAHVLQLPNNTKILNGEYTHH